MAAHLHWRLVGFSVAGGGPLELSEARIYAAGTVADEDATLSCTFAPESGALADLRDGLASGMVSWPHTAHSSPGFALVWQLAAAQDINGVRLGAGGSPGTFPASITLQWSDDASSWTTATAADGILYPGMNALTGPPAANADMTSNNVVLLLRADGPDGSTTVADAGPAKITLVCSGGAKISTAQAKFDGGSMYLSGANACVIRGAIPALSFEQDWTIRLWVYRLSDTAGTVLHIRSGTPVGAATQGQNGIHILITASGALSVDNGVIGTPAGPAGSVPVNTWTFIEILRSAGVTTGYVSTVPVLSHPSQATMGVLQEAVVGRFTQNDFSIQGPPTFYGHVDDLCIKLGEAVRESSVPTLRYAGSGLPPTESGVARACHLARLPERYVGAEVSGGAASGHMREHTFMDAYHGGRAIIRSTVKRKNTPVDTPLRRRVDLIDERSRLSIRETWSDAATGNYEFRGIREDLVYSVVAWDQPRNQRAVIADGLTLANGGVELP